MTVNSLSSAATQAANVLQSGGVIAYPTEYCFGLGCDPRNQASVERLLRIKHRRADQGVILIAADLAQVSHYADLECVPNLDRVIKTWPGPYTWLLPSKESVPDFIRGKHESIAMRIPQHEFCLELLENFGHPIVSTSANRSGQPELLSAQSVRDEMGQECDFVVEAPVGGALKASSICDALTGETLR